MSVVFTLQNNTTADVVGSSALAQNVFCNGGYRFGFNGMQRDDEIAGRGNSLDFGARMYDSRLGRLWSLDPRWRDFPAWSVYSYASNSPILFLDEEGEGPGHSILKWLANETGGTWSVQAYGSISIGVVRTAAKGMAVDKKGNVALLMTSSVGWQGNSVGVSGGVSLSFAPRQSVRDVPGNSVSLGVQGKLLNSIQGGISADFALENGRANGKGALSVSLGLGLEASPAAVSPTFSANLTTAVLMSESDFSKVEKGYSNLLKRTNNLNSSSDNTGYYDPISSSLEFVPTSNEGEFEAVWKQKYEYRPYTGGAAHQVIEETVKTGIKFKKEGENLISDSVNDNQKK